MKEYYFVTRIGFLVNKSECRTFERLAMYEPWLIDKCDEAEFFDGLAWVEFTEEELFDLDSTVRAQMSYKGSEQVLVGLLSKVDFLMQQFEKKLAKSG